MIESVLAEIEQKTGRIDYWRNRSQKQRWVFPLPILVFTYYMDYVYDSIFSCLTTKEQSNCYEAFGGLVCTGKA